MKHAPFPLFAFSLILLCSCTKDSVTVLNLYLSETSFEMPKGGVHQLSTEIYPEDADNKSIDWTSSDPSVATVNNDGIVTALNVGKTIITAMAADGSGKQDQCNVEVYQCIESVSFDKAEYVVMAGQSIAVNANVLPENAKYKELEWSSDDETIAAVDSIGTVRGISSGTCHIVASAPNNIKAECIIKVNKDPYNGHAYVDLGLPSGTLWATMNMGASQPEDFGDYFAWGETKGYGQEDTSNTNNYSYNNSSSYIKTYYIWCTYKYGNDDGYITTNKYCKDSICGIIDNRNELELSDDAARANWGANWRIPSQAQVQELVGNCTQKWALQNGSTGILVTGPNGGQIFLPAAGFRWENKLYYDGLEGYYWSSTLGPVTDYFVAGLFFSDSHKWKAEQELDRCWGIPIRPVCQ